MVIFNIYVIYIRGNRIKRYRNAENELLKTRGEQLPLFLNSRFFTTE